VSVSACIVLGLVGLFFLLRAVLLPIASSSVYVVMIALAMAATLLADTMTDGSSSCVLRVELQ
jgi:hypothetical protein